MTPESGNSTPIVRDWISLYLDYTANIFSPQIFRLWSGITAVAGALERRVWVRTGSGNIFPNLFTILVGPPASGKSLAINPIRRLWGHIPSIKQASNNATSASIIDELIKAKRSTVGPDGEISEFHSIQIAIREFGVFFPEYDKAMFAKLTDFYDNPDDSYQETRRTGKVTDARILRPQITILGGGTPDALNERFDESAWNQGFCSRLILVWSQQPPRPKDMFKETDMGKALEPEVLAGLHQIANRHGQIELDDNAQFIFNDWNSNGQSPVPLHPRLRHYNDRRATHVLKLCMIAAASAGKAQVGVNEMRRAMSWLFEAEKVMEEIFTSMSARGSLFSQMEQLHALLWRMYKDNKMKAVPAAMIRREAGRFSNAMNIHAFLREAELTNVITPADAEKTYYTVAPPSILREHSLKP